MEAQLGRVWVLLWEDLISWTHLLKWRNPKINVPGDNEAAIKDHHVKKLWKGWYSSVKEITGMSGMWWSLQEFGESSLLKSPGFSRKIWVLGSLRGAALARAVRRRWCLWHTCNSWYLKNFCRGLALPGAARRWLPAFAVPVDAFVYGITPDAFSLENVSPAFALRKFTSGEQGSPGLRK